ncbi:MAG: glycosyltransferase family 4 protein [Methanobacteriota archaeon]
MTADPDRGLDGTNLALFFTRGLSLAVWAATGMLEREIALYRALRPHVASVLFATYGRDDDRHAPILPGLRVLQNEGRLPVSLHAALLPWRFGRLGGRWIVKSNQLPGSTVALRAARRAQAPFVARCGYPHYEFVVHQFGAASWRARRALREERTVFRAADHVLVTSEAARKAAVARHGLSEEAVTVVPNYVETDVFVPKREPDDGGRTRVLAVGRLDRQKNLPALFEAMQPLDVHLDLVGTGPLEGPLRELAARAGLRVTFHGNLPHGDLPRLMNRATLFVLPSVYEGHPKALLEAMACGLAVVGTDVHGTREVLEDGKNGLVCGTDVPSLRAAIELALGDPGLRRDIGRAARDHVVATMSLSAVVPRELAVYRELIP